MRAGKNGFRRITAMVCALALCASLIPTTVFAEVEPTASPAGEAYTTEPAEPQTTETDTEEPKPEVEESNKVESPVGENNENSIVTDTDPVEETPGLAGAENEPGNDEAAANQKKAAEKVEPKVSAASAPENSEVGVENDLQPAPRAGANIYEDSEKGISINVNQGSGDESASFVVLLDGKIVADNITIDNLSLLGNKLTISVPDGYDVRCRGMDGNIRADHLAGYWNLYPYGGTLYISIATSKKSDDVEIADGDKAYGTFSWMKGEADTAVFPRRLTVYVNEDQVYQTTVATPADLTNSGSNDQFWFTPNTDLYKMDVKLDSDLTLDQGVLADLDVYLTTKCPCGHSYCTCPGGKECQCASKDCDCALCNPALKDNEIRTDFGTIEYKEPSGSGYNLTVELYVNGELRQTVDNNGNPLRVRVGEFDCLNFTPAEGYYYFNDENSYDISTAYGGSWGQRTGYLMINELVGGDQGSARDYNNVLKIYLWNFKNHTKLDVERRPGDWGGEANIQDNVTGYTISYEVYDPAAKETKVYSYEATSFLLAQSQIVPIGTPVTLTAICKSPYEVSKWSSGDGYTAVELEGSEGSTSKTAVKGNRATLTVTSTAYTSVTVYVDGVRKVTPPTEEELVENKDFVFGKENGAVIVDCLSKEEHTDGSFGLKQDTFAISELQGNSSDGYKVTVTINNEDAYVDEYEASCQNREHTRKDTTNAKTITLNWVVVQQDDGTYKSQWKAEKPATIEVTCKDNTPTVPDDDTIKELLDQKVTVRCTNDANPHDTMFKTYGALVGGYEVGELKGNATQGYSVDVTIQCDTYVTQYNTDTKSKHVLASNESKTKTITLCYDMAAAAWVKPEQTVINVTCKVDKPDSPDDETVQDLLKNKVLVKCVNTAAAQAAAIPQTGDTMPVGLLGGVAVVAAAAFVVLLVIRKRKHND